MPEENGIVMNTEATLDTVCFLLMTPFSKSVLRTNAMNAYVLLVPAISFDLSGLMLCPVVLKEKRNAPPLHHLLLCPHSLRLTEA